MSDKAIVTEEELIERLIAVESAIEGEKNSKTKKFIGLASAVALIISIMSGALGLFNTFFVAPSLEVKAAARALSVEIEQHRQKLDELSALPRFASQSQRAVAENAITWGQASLMGITKASSADVLEALKATDLIMLSWVAMQQEEPALSERLAGLAINKAASYGDKMTAKATLAQSAFFFDPPRGTELFYILFDEIAKGNSINRSRAFMGAVSQMGNVFVMKNDCKGLTKWAAKIKNEYFDLFPDREDMDNYLQTEIDTALDNMRC